MEIKQMLEEALRKGEFIEFLRGDNGYMVEQSEFSPGAGVTDVSDIISSGIYEEYRENKDIKSIFEQGLLKMLDMTDFDVYMVCLYLLFQFFKEAHELAIFELEKEQILEKFKREIRKRKVRIQMYGIKGPDNYFNKNAWEMIEGDKFVFKRDYNIELF